MDAQAELSLRWAHIPFFVLSCVGSKSVDTTWNYVREMDTTGPMPRGYKPYSCSTQLSMKFELLINLKLLTIANSFLLNIANHENFSANKYENANFCWHYHIY